VVPSQLDDCHEGGDRDEAESDHAVEAASLRVRPGVAWPNDLPPVVRVGAAALADGQLYGTWKRANEGTAAAFWAEDGFPSIGIRPALVYGVGRDRGVTPL
jgi:nucleoside-diphosphate-sugar epimerase